jgi:thioredoxin-related protein
MVRASKLFIASIILVLFACSAVSAQEVKDGLTWYTDVNKAYEVSQKSNKPVFAFFTGSDWCGWCHRLQRNVFAKQGFKDWAKKNVILLELDFPRKKELPQAIMEQNNGLQQFFGVQGFPTIWIFTMAKDQTTNKFNIAALGQLGYPQSEPGKEEVTFLANADQVLKNKRK